MRAGNAMVAVSAALVAGAGFGTTSAAEEARTVGELADYCQAERFSVESVLCGALIEGVAQMLVWNCLTRDYGWRPDPTVAAGRPPSLEAAVGAFIAWVEDNPGDENEEWHLGLTSALTEAFPCERGGPRS